MTVLSHQDVASFEKEGMICIPDFLSKDETKAMMARSRELLAALDLSTHPRTQFTTGENSHIGDQYFFDSSDKISFFFDTDAFDDSGALRYPKEKAVNKIGHGLHMRDQLFKDITLLEKCRSVAESLRFKDPRVLQSMLIFKNPIKKSASGAERENAVPPHTDAAFLFTQPQSAVGFWFALEDCTIENGCLSYSPGTHLTHPVTKRFVRVDGKKSGCKFIDVENAGPEGPSMPLDGYKTVECKAGSLILIHNAVLHKLENNRSDMSRYAYAFHVIDGVKGYDELNWLQVPSSGGTEFTKLFDDGAKD